jgi:hypothetical protein
MRYMIISGGKIITMAAPRQELVALDSQTRQRVHGCLRRAISPKIWISTWADIERNEGCLD